MQSDFFPKSKRKLAVSILAASALFVLDGFIFHFSGQDGMESGNVSLHVTESCVEFVNSLAKRNWSQEVIRQLSVSMEYLVRKAAHFTEYALMGTLVYVMFLPWEIAERKRRRIVAIWVFLSAALDELHQLFVPGRTGRIFDVGLDTLGGLVGMFLCSLLVHLFFKYVRK